MIERQEDVTKAVLEQLEGASDARFRQIMSSAVQHLHAFARDVKLTEPEFQQACAVIASLGQASNASHNEVVLAAGSLGLSSLVCLLNNGNFGQTETTANLLGPFWRMNAPATANGSSIVRSPTPGAHLHVKARVLDTHGAPIADALVDVWHSSNEGYYENQDPEQADMNLRGIFTTDAHGYIDFHTVKPLGYPIPVNGPVGNLLRMQGRHNMRPAHIHFMIRKEGFKTQFSQVYASDDPNLHTDVQFGVTQRLVGEFLLDQTAPKPSYRLEYEFVIEAGKSVLPKAPITAKTSVDRPALEVLAARLGGVTPNA
jgi:hydroxyquinol 1,2-dioxygenase